ncbi:MAG: hypothetical protein AB7P21_04435 [Lautropia sp.]
MADSLARSEETDPEAWLEEWLDSAQSLLAHSQQHASSTVLVNADEVQRRPRRLATLLRSKWGIYVETPARMVHGDMPDALVQALATAFVERDPSLLDMASELIASCAILPGTRLDVGRGFSESAVDSAIAARRLTDLLEVERKLAQERLEREAERDTLSRERQCASEESTRLATTVRELASQREALTARIDSAEGDLIAANSQVDEARRKRKAVEERLESLEVQLQTMSRELDEARTVAEDADRRHEEQRACATHAEQARSQLVQQLETVERRRSDSERKLAEAERRREALEREVKSAKEMASIAGEDAKLLLQRLHQAQEELEKALLRQREAEDALTTAKAGGGSKKLEQALRAAREECELAILQSNQLQQELLRIHDEKSKLLRTLSARPEFPEFDVVTIGSLEVVGKRDTPPHRELSFSLRDVRVGQHEIAEVQVRLVEHWGRPGMAIFSHEGAPAPIKAWQESGREDERPYLLLVHGEASAEAVFDAMCTLDWLVVQALAMRMHQVLAAGDGEFADSWALLSRRLVSSLRQRPPRLRHDGVVVMPIALDSPDVARWGLVLERASYGERVWKRLTLQWRPSGPNRSLELLRDEDGGPPLLVWPADADGIPLRSLRLPLGEAVDSSEMVRTWGLVTEADKHFVQEILTQLPRLAEAIESHRGAGSGDMAGNPELRQAATLAARDAHALLYPPPADSNAQSNEGRRLLTRIARRLRPVPRASDQLAVAEAPRP